MDDEQDEVSEDDGVVRTATALHCLAAISTVNSSKRASTLLNYFLLTHEKNINTGKYSWYKYESFRLPPYLRIREGIYNANCVGLSYADSDNQM